MRAFLCFVLMCIVCSCGSKDSDGSNPVLPQLVVSVENTVISLDTTMNFKATANNKTVSDVDFYVNDKKVNNPYTFNQLGVFTISAKKKGYLDSKPVSIKVIPNSVELELTLEVLHTHVEIGEEVTFVVKVDGVPLNDAVISQIGGGPIVQNKWRATELGKFTFIARKNNFKDSNIVEVEVVEDVVSSTNYVKINGKTIYVSNSRMYVAATKDSNGEFKPFLYVQDGKGHYKFLVDIERRKSGARQVLARLELLVYQDLASSVMIFPSDNPSFTTHFVDAIATMDFSTISTFSPIDVVKLGFGSGGLTAEMDISLLNADGDAVYYKGTLTNQSLGYVPVSLKEQNVLFVDFFEKKAM